MSYSSVQQTEKEALDFNVALSLSLVIFGFDGVELQILTVPKKNEPFKGALTLPSKHLKSTDELLLSARRLFENLAILNLIASMLW